MQKGAWRPGLSFRWTKSRTRLTAISIGDQI